MTTAMDAVKVGLWAIAAHALRTQLWGPRQRHELASSATDAVGPDIGPGLPSPSSNASASASAGLSRSLVAKPRLLFTTVALCSLAP